MIWAIVFGILSLLLQWFLNRKAAGDMTEWEKKKANHALHMMQQCTIAGQQCGCSAAEDTEETQAIQKSCGPNG